jgi:hypothetical protein
VNEIKPKGSAMARQKASDKDVAASSNNQTILDESSGPQAPQASQIRFRSQQTVLHHLFKAELANMQKNVSFVPGQPEIKSVEHVHFFHTVNSMGMPQKYTNEVGGHFHEVFWQMDAQGNLVAKCGPALKKVSKRGRDNLTKTVIVPVEYLDKVSAETPFNLKDDHSHGMTYHGSDEISAKKVQDIQMKNAQLISAMEPKTTPEADLVENDR